MPLSRRAGLSPTCPDGNFPPFTNSTFTPNRMNAHKSSMTASRIVVIGVGFFFFECKYTNLFEIFRYISNLFRNLEGAKVRFLTLFPFIEYYLTINPDFI